MTLAPLGFTCNPNLDTGHLTLITTEGTSTIRAGQGNFAQVIEAFKAKDWEKVEKLINPVKAVTSYFAQYRDIEIKNEQVLYKNETLHGSVVTRILDFIKEDVDVSYMLKFLANLMENPSRRSREEFYDFLDHKSLAIDSDGYVLAYKKVCDNYKDFFSGQYDNSPGNKPTMPRPQVDDNRDRTCSVGFHVGSLQYSRDEYHKNSGRIVVVRFHPKDVVSVPLDHSAQKCRVCEYEVLRDFEGEISTSYINLYSSEHEDTNTTNCEKDALDKDDTEELVEKALVEAGIKRVFGFADD